MNARACGAGLLLSLASLAAAPSYDWRLPPGFPVPRVPADNPMTAEKVELGRHLFYDERLSGSGAYACASCHRQERAFTDGRARAKGATGGLHRRSAPSLANAAYAVSLTWADPGVRSLEQQALVPMFNDRPVELGFDEAIVLTRLRSDERYRRLFAEAFPGEEQPFRADNVARALASFERTLVSGDSPYNRLVYRGEMDALSEAARRGMRLFFSARTHCSDCHAGFSFSGPVTFEGAGGEIEPVFHNTGLYNVAGTGYPGSDRGLGEVTGSAADDGRFRAPTLYNVALTAPYMHDGSVATLEEVVALYAAGGRRIDDGPRAGNGGMHPGRSERTTGFPMSAEEQHDLVEFLKSLTDTAFTHDPRFSDPWRPEAVWTRSSD